VYARGTSNTKQLNWFHVNRMKETITYQNRIEVSRSSQATELMSILKLERTDEKHFDTYHCKNRRATEHIQLRKGVQNHRSPSRTNTALPQDFISTTGAWMTGFRKVGQNTQECCKCKCSQREMKNSP